MSRYWERWGVGGGWREGRWWKWRLWHTEGHSRGWEGRKPTGTERGTVRGTASGSMWITYCTIKAPHTPPKPIANCLHPTTLLHLVWPVQQKTRHWTLNTPLRCAASSTVDCTFCACAKCNKRVAPVFKKDAGQEVYACNSLYFWSKRNWTISDKNSCILNKQQGITKRTQINSSWKDITASLMPVLQNMKTENDGAECIEKRSSHSIPPFPHTTLIHKHTTNQRIQWLRLRMLSRSRQRPRSSESFQSSWTHRTYLFPASSNGWAGVFLPLGLWCREGVFVQVCLQSCVIRIHSTVCHKMGLSAINSFLRWYVILMLKKINKHLAYILK